MNDLKATAQLPNMTIELTRREVPDGEKIVVEITARPSFAAMETLLQTSMVWFWPWLSLNPFVAAWSGRLDQPEVKSAAPRKAVSHSPQLRLVRPPEEK